MELTVPVPYEGALAYYDILQESEGIFLAILDTYEGELSLSPPARIVLIRGVRRWTGSFTHQPVLDELGRAIEARLAQDAASSAGDQNIAAVNPPV